MRAILFFSIVAAALLALQSPVRGQIPGDTRPLLKTAPLAADVNVRCPDQVPTAIAIVPAGWTAAKGPEAREKFMSVAVTSEAGKPTIGCVYGNKGEYGAFVLSRKMPTGYDCKVENSKTGDVTCRRRIVAK